MYVCLYVQKYDLYVCINIYKKWVFCICKCNLINNRKNYIFNLAQNRCSSSDKTLKESLTNY